MPPGPRRYGGQTEIDRIGAGIEHQAKCALLIFLDETGKLFFFRVSPVGHTTLRAKPMDLGVRVELLLAQNRMRTTKGDHATGEAEEFLVLFQTTPVKPAHFVVLAVGIVVAALRAAKFVPAEQHRDPAGNSQSTEKR